MGRSRHLICLGLWGIILGAAVESIALTPAEMAALRDQLPAPATAQIDFETQIRPIFEASCLRCHGAERPKGRFRLDNRENALKGGSSGIAIVPGESAASPLIYYVARLVEEMEMPPAGDDEPLTSEQVSMLRAWIDQGANWDETPTRYPSLTLFSIAPAAQWFRVTGDERRFRDHTGIKDGWNGGIQSWLWQEQVTEELRFTGSGHVFANPEEYTLDLLLEKRDFGFFRAGAENYREYYDDSGGYLRTQNPPGFELDQDLFVDRGRVWMQAGLHVPDRPWITVGYEYRYREGSQSTLHWGDVGTISPELNPMASDALKIYPGWRTVDETTHSFSLDAGHEVRGVTIENNFRADLSDLESSRHDLVFYERGAGAEKFQITREQHDHWRISDSLRLEKQILDWLFLSGGYHYSRLEGEYSLSSEPIYPLGFIRAPAEYLFTDSIVLEQDVHVMNANVQLGPWGGLTLYGGVQGEWLRQDGLGEVTMEFGDPINGFFLFPVRVGSDLERARAEERLGLRYNGLPRTVIFAEGRAQQESLGQWEELQGDFSPFVRDTDATTDLGEARAGFTIAPLPQVSVTSQYRYREKDTGYNHLLDEAFGFPNLGYSAFITGREIVSHDFSVKLLWRPARWVTTALEYQLFEADYTTTTQAEEFVSPGGSILAGNQDAHVYSAHLGLAPWRRVRLTGSAMVRTTRIRTADGLGPVLQPYEGVLYTLSWSGDFFLNDKTDFNAGYSFTRADYEESDPALLPLGVKFDWHIVHAGITRRLRTNVIANLQYRFYQYDEESSGGWNNYTAHGVIASMAMRLD